MNVVERNKQNNSLCENISTGVFEFPGTLLSTEIIILAKAHP